ncbi:MAG: NAD(P)/FAD-dependent oxidoreductase [Thermoplasmatales archaeon]|nr:NAD(P)/FAD-dependent oxidoreductase [Thermoplasmatales archaeon]
MNYDVVVVGAGPAGSTAAKFLSEKGVKVLLIDKDKFPRDKPCGGGICEHITEFDHIREKIEKDPSDFLDSICIRGKIVSPSSQHTTDYLSETPLFYNVRRKKFDYGLVQFAIDAGAEVLENCKVKEVFTTQEKAVVKLANSREFICKVIVGAGGAYDVVTNYLRKKERLREKQGKDFRMAVVEEFEVGEEFIDRAYGKERTSMINLKHANLNGYAWVFSKHDILNIGYGGFNDEMKKIDIKKEFKNYLDFLKRNGYLPKWIESKKLKGAPVPFVGNIKKTYTDRIVIVGDAAGFVSPLTGEGIYYAMDSGKIASEVISKALEKEDFSAQSLKSYQNIWRKKWGKDLKALRFFHRMLMKWPEKFVKYGSKDEKLKKIFIALFIGNMNASRMKWKIISRIIMDFFVYDVFRRE